MSAEGRTKTGSSFALQRPGWSSLVLLQQESFNDKDTADQTLWNDWFWPVTAAGGFKSYFVTQLSAFIGVGISP